MIATLAYFYLYPHQRALRDFGEQISWFADNMDVVCEDAE